MRAQASLYEVKEGSLRPSSLRARELSSYGRELKRAEG